jgi:hypothetical protein
LQNVTPIMDRRRRHLPLLTAFALAGSLAACASLAEEDGALEDAFTGDPKLLSCVDREPAVRAAVNQLFDAIDKGTSPVTSVDALIGALPSDARKNILFLTDTRSMAKVYPLAQKKAMQLGATDSDDYAYHQDGLKWCSDAGGTTNCVESRVLFTSTEADFIGSFTTHPDSPSARRFEAILFDASTSTVDMFDVKFEDGARPVVTKNPRDCMKCHQGRDGSVNYRFDPYRFWSFVTPWDEDFLRGDSVEADWYLSLLDRVGAGEAKLSKLTPNNTAKQIRDALAAAGRFQLTAPGAAVDFGGRDTPALNLSHQLLEKNACRAAASMARRPDWTEVRYAAVGALIDCPDVGAFFPTTGSYTRETADDFFTQMGEGKGATSFELDVLIGETKRRQASLLSDKISRRYDHFTELLGGERAMEEIRGAIANGPVRPGYGVTNFEKDSYAAPITKARYLLEPLGVDVTQWSMSVDRVMQSHVEFMFPLATQPVMIDFLRADDLGGRKLRRAMEVFDCQNLDTSGPQGKTSQCYATLQNMRGDLCPKLAAKSRAALVDHQPILLQAEPAQTMRDYEVEPIAELQQAAAAMAAQRTLAELDAAAAPIYQMCSGCHEFGYDTGGAPYLPFGKIADLDALFRRGVAAKAHELDGSQVGIVDGFGRPFTFRYVSTADRIWDRINRHPRQHGMMPRTKVALTRDQKITLRAHMLKAQAGE